MSHGDSLQALSEEWRRRAETLRRYGGAASATALETCASDLDAALRRRNDTVLTLQEAARATGYSASHLGRLVRDGIIPNAGRAGAPRIALRDLPKKVGGTGGSEPGPGLVDSAAPAQVSNAEVVRSIIERGSG